MTDTGLALDYVPRSQFVPFHMRMERWACMVVHRRAGKTFASLMDTLDHAINKPGGHYAYIAPFRHQAKTVAWDYLKAFSRPVLASPPNEQELRVDLKNGARITLFGSDNPDALRGAFFDGVVLDEYADMSPSLWTQVIRPALADRKGWATVIGTIKGRNQLWQAYEAARGDPNWYTSLLRASETGILDPDELSDAKRTMPPEQYNSEFECDQNSAILGSYYGSLLSDADSEKRITDVACEPSIPVHCAWDLGIGDSTAIWFWQAVAGELRVIDYYENHGKPLPHYVSELESRGYEYGVDYLPHDAKVRSLETGRTRVETLQSLGRRCQLVPMHKIQDGINAVRALLPKMYFDATKCDAGIEALRQYQTDWDDKKKCFSERPRHDWTSHASDSARYMCMAYRELIPAPIVVPRPLYKSLSRMSYSEYDLCPTHQDLELSCGGDAIIQSETRPRMRDRV